MTTATVTALALSGSPAGANPTPPIPPGSPAAIKEPTAAGTQTRWGERTVAVGAKLGTDTVNSVWVADPFGTDGTKTEAGTVYAVKGSSLITNSGGSQTPATAIYTIHPPTPTVNQHFGFVVTNIGDVNGDNVPDLAIGEDSQDTATPRTYNSAGHVYVYSGKLGNLLYTINSPTGTIGERFGSRIGKAGDIYNTTSAGFVGTGSPAIVGDAKSEIIIGASASQDGTVNKGVGKAYIFNGDPGSYTVTPPATTGAGNTPVRTLTNPGKGQVCSSTSSCGNFGLSVQGVGDTNGDGVPDQLVSAPTYNDTVGGHTSQGRMYIYDGKGGGLATGTVLQTIDDPTPQQGAYFGFQDVTPNSPGDVNADNKNDVYGEGWLQDGAIGTGQGESWVFNGFTGAMLYTLNDPHATPSGSGRQFGWSMTATTDGNSTTPALLVGASPHKAANTDEDGGAYVFGSAPASPGSQPLLEDLPLPSYYQQTSATDAGPNLGWTVAAPGSLDGSGYQTYLAGAPFWNNGTTVDEGLLFAFYHNATTGYAPAYCPPLSTGAYDTTGTC
ncbi:MAG: integrin alpha [Actinomycetota bacterium]|nr:integrin alpha [Actinomycetota bacterium]